LSKIQTIKFHSLFQNFNYLITDNYNSKTKFLSPKHFEIKIKIYLVSQFNLLHKFKNNRRLVVNITVK